MLPQSSKNGKNIHVKLQVGQKFMKAILDVSLKGPPGHLTQVEWSVSCTYVIARNYFLHWRCRSLQNCYIK